MLRIFRKPDFLGIVLLSLLGVGASLAFSDAEPWLFTSGEQLAFAVVFSLIPGLLWLFFYYRQDLYDKEPPQFLLGLFALGALFAGAVSIPLELIFESGLVSVTGNPVRELLINVLFYGALAAMSVFVIVRFTVYAHPAFNEPADGIIYSVSAALGYAAAQNIAYLNSLESINMAIVPIRMVEFYMISAIFSGIMGYYIGKARFSKGGGEGLLIFGLVLASILQGGYDQITASVQAVDYNVWKSLGITTVCVLVGYGFMYALLQKALKASPYNK